MAIHLRRVLNTGAVVRVQADTEAELDEATTHYVGRGYRITSSERTGSGEYVATLRKAGQ